MGTFSLAGLLGTLPHRFFTVSVSSAGENLAQLLYSVLLTGFLFRNLQCRRELSASFAGPAQPQRPVLPPSPPPTASSSRAASLPSPPLSTQQQQQRQQQAAGGTPRGSVTRDVRGSVLRWAPDADRPASLPAVEYISELEREVAVRLYTAPF